MSKIFWVTPRINSEDSSPRMLFLIGSTQDHRVIIRRARSWITTVNLQVFGSLTIVIEEILIRAFAKIGSWILIRKKIWVILNGHSVRDSWSL